MMMSDHLDNGVDDEGYDDTGPYKTNVNFNKGGQIGYAKVKLDIEKNKKEKHREEWRDKIEYAKVPEKYIYSDDPIIEKVIQRIADRADKGMSKYASSMEDNHGGIVYWIDHAIEEALDLAAYLTKLKTIIEGEK